MQAASNEYLRYAFRELPAFSVAGLGSFRRLGEAADSTEPAEYIFEQEEAAPGLASVLQSEYGLSPREANRIVSDIRVSMRWAFNTRNMVEIPGAGVLYRHQDGRTLFYPLPIAEAEDPPRPAVEQVDADDIEEVDENGFTAPDTDGSSASARTARNFDLGKNLPYWLRMGALVIFLSLALALLMWYFIILPNRSAAEIETQRVERAPDPAELQPPGVEDPLGRTPEEGKVPGSVPSGDVPYDNPTRVFTPPPSSATPAPPVAAGQPAFHLIAGSFSTKASAENFQREMIAQGSDAQIMPATSDGTTTYRVSVFRSSSRAAVEQHKKYLLKNGKTAGWILSVK